MTSHLLKYVIWFVAILALPSALFASYSSAEERCGHIDREFRSTNLNLPPHISELLTADRQDEQAFCTKSTDEGGHRPALSKPFKFTGKRQQSVVQPYKPDEVLAIIDESQEEALSIGRQFGLELIAMRPIETLGRAMATFRILDASPVAAVIEQLSADPRVHFVEANHLYEMQQDQQPPPRYALRKIGLHKLRQRRGGKGVRIAIIDTAVDEEHPLLRDAIEARFNAIPNRSVRERSHGTAVAGLIAGRDPVAGIASGAVLLIARSFDRAPGGQDTAAADAVIASLDWATKAGAQIINLSFSGPRSVIMSELLAISRRRGVLVVAAAGNNGPEAPYSYPAAEPSVIAVTATDRDDRIYGHANRGRYIFIAAPGVDLLTASNGGGFQLATGTSCAAAVVSGIAALIIESRPDIGVPEIIRRMERSVRDLGAPGRDEVFGHGLINGPRALRHPEDEITSPTLSHLREGAPSK